MPTREQVKQLIQVPSLPGLATFCNQQFKPQFKPSWLKQVLPGFLPKHIQCSNKIDLTYVQLCQLL